MKINSNKAIYSFLILFISAVFVVPFVSSCGKAGIVSGASSNTQLAVFNMSPNVGPINLYADYINQNATSPYIYTVTGSYFYISPSDTLFQIRTTQFPSTSIISIDKLNLLSNHKYSLFVSGLASGIGYKLLIDDTAATAPSGFGKMRFLNTSIQSQDIGLDVTANGTLAFSAIKYNQLSDYVTLPAGSYTLQITQHGQSATVLSTPAISTITIADGSLYTLYSYGVVGQTDTSAFNAALFQNR